MKIPNISIMFAPYCMHNSLRCTILSNYNTRSKHSDRTPVSLYSSQAQLVEHKQKISA